MQNSDWKPCPDCKGRSGAPTGRGDNPHFPCKTCDGTLEVFKGEEKWKNPKYKQSRKDEQYAS